MLRMALFMTLAFEMCGGNADIPPNAAFEIDMMDTTLPSGKFLDYWLATDSTVMITWGDATHGKVGALESERWTGWAPHYYWCEFDHYIGVRYSCGSPCWDLTLLPLDKTDTLIHLMEDLLIDTTRGYILANGCPYEEQ